METLRLPLPMFRLNCRKTSSEVELMETFPGSLACPKLAWRRKTSSEVELMETSRQFAVRAYPVRRKTSSEVELMETISRLERRRITRASQDFF